MSGYIHSQLTAIEMFMYYFETDTEFVLIDPGFGADQIMGEKVLKTGKKIVILITHGHFDHIAGIELFLKQKGTEVYCGEDDLYMLFDKSLKQFDGTPFDISQYKDLIHPLKGGETLQFGPHKFRTYHIRGHTHGGIFYVDDEAKLVLTGDSIQKGHVGMMTVPTLEIDLLKANDKKFLQSLPRDYVLLPGHTAPTTAGEELDTNPYLQ